MRKTVAVACAAALSLTLGLAGCAGQGSGTQEASSDSATASAESTSAEAASGQNSAAVAATTSEEAAAIEEALNLANMGAEWTYSEDASAWTLTPVVAVVNPEIQDEQGVSVCVPGAYVTGIDTDERTHKLHIGTSYATKIANNSALSLTSDTGTPLCG